MRIFVDANVYLAFIEAKNEKKAYFHKFNDMVTDGSHSLLMPDITFAEVIRNASSVALEYINNINKYYPPEPQFATSIRSNKDTKQILKKFNGYKEELDTLKRKYIFSIEEFEKLIKNMQSKSDKTTINEDIIKLAINRKVMGNPPGKRVDPVGDEIVWELILNAFTNQDLAIISSDGDWGDKLNKFLHESKLNRFLKYEWKQRTQKKIILYATLAEFMKKEGRISVSKEEIEAERRQSNVLSDFMVTATSSMISPESLARVYQLGSAQVGTLTTATGSYLPFAIHNCSFCGNPLSDSIYYNNLGNPICKDCINRNFNS